MDAAGMSWRMEEGDVDDGSHEMGAAVAGVPQWMEKAMAGGGSCGGWRRPMRRQMKEADAGGGSCGGWTRLWWGCRDR